jgi:hypothetical protein
MAVDLMAAEVLFMGCFNCRDHDCALLGLSFSAGELA